VVNIGGRRLDIAGVARGKRQGPVRGCDTGTRTGLKAPIADANGKGRLRGPLKILDIGNYGSGKSI
jgi:hypothetical protein